MDGAGPQETGLQQQQQQDAMVWQVLVQEAQQEIGNLRAELYSTRRIAEERRQALDAMTAARDQLAAVAHQLEGQAQHMHQQLLALPQLQQELQALQELNQRLQKDNQLQLQARRILESELADERTGRSAAEESRAKAEADRGRLALLRDDLSAQLREQVELLMRKVIALKKSRDKLLAQMDRQSVELEQMSLDSQALAAAATQARAEGDQWRSQAQDALLTISQLQEMLAEGASWEASAAAAAAADAPNGTDQGSSQQAAGLQDSSSVAAAAAEASVAPPAVAHRVLLAPKDARFNEDCTVFIEEFRIRGNEAGPDQRANIITIANLLQEVGGNHGVAMWGRANSGFAAMPGMDHLIFVATRMQIRMEAYPKWGDLVRLETYFAEDGRLTTRRDWRISNADTGEYLGAATSTWVTINAESRRLAKIPEAVKQRFLQLAPSPPRCAIPTSDTRRKLPEFVWPPQLTAPSQLGRRSDMDPNGHINNVAYLAWAMEVIPDHVYQQYQLSEVEMDFKAECTAGDQIECFGMPLTDCASSNGSTQQFLHLLRKGGSNTEVRARVHACSRVGSGAAVFVLLCVMPLVL
ncbi:hypothetical protein OEZ85_014109 [Tetradesmus obliquus]|uniref:Acyl-[acyl-carrier-protein] hydrolase n=1 Tax=Tetradesmus obliquus TaxID=3088 RepID=A0ABY8U7C5_TETOB|nr:hypothetical protein OEZ85_014109 [Tetradesmus obliquus]